MKYKENWGETQLKFTNWWKRRNTGRPLMVVISPKDGVDPRLPEELAIQTVDDKYRNAERMVARYRHYCETHDFLGESFPNMSADFGPGSLAGYLGSKIIFNPDTVWFEHFVEDWSDLGPLKYDPENPWWIEHYSLARRCRELAGEDFYIGIPDIIENLDILASLRSPSDLIFDMIDDPEMIARRLAELDEIYFDYYDRFYDLLKDEQGGSCYTVFQIWGPGRTAKVQCDFSALISPQQYKDFIVPSLRQQTRRLDQVLYHLDGPDAIKHLDAVLEIDEIDALQWTSGDYGPDGTMEEWYEIYDKARKAGKSLWIKVYSGDFSAWISGVDKLVRRYGSDALFLHFPEMARAQANELIQYAERNWSDVRGIIRP
jgi:5-methyltetrahydrofolate--homocysteine methyltransferase